VSASYDRVQEFGGLRVETFVTGRWHENCYVLTDLATSEAAIIDPGDDDGRILQHLSDSKLIPRLILLTHSHYDHIGAAESISGHASLPCLLHAGDRALLDRAPLYALSFEKRRVRVPRAVETFQDQTRFGLGSFEIRALLLPGHTPGSVGLRCGPLFFSGDTLLRAKRGRTDLPGGDAATIDKSIQTLIDSTDGLSAIFPGHGHPWSAEEARAWWSREKARPGS
jgi:glyoxylase-like metal-dependent hydrolase (beta-lactamase superfamily II)